MNCQKRDQVIAPFACALVLAFAGCRAAPTRGVDLAAAHGADIPRAGKAKTRALPRSARPAPQAYAYYATGCMHLFEARELDRARNQAEGAKHWRTALACFKRALKFDPASVEIRRALAACQIRLGETAAMVQTLKGLSKVLGEDPKGQARVARTFEQLGQLAQAARAYEKALEPPPPPGPVAPARRRAMSSLAAVYRRLGRCEPALKWYKRLRKAEPKNAEWLAQVAECCAALGRHEEAVRHFKQYFESQADITSAAHARRLALYSGEYEQMDKPLAGAAALLHLADAHPRNAKLQELITLLYRKAGQPDKAIATAENFLKVRAGAHGVRLLVAELYLSADKPKKAISSYGAILGASPASAGTSLKQQTATRLASLAGEFAAKKQYDLAAACYEGILKTGDTELAPKQLVRARLALAQAYSRLKRYDDAAHLLRSVMAAGEQGWRVRMFLADVLANAGRHKDAEAALRKTIALFDKDPEVLKQARALLAEVLFREKRYNEAAAILEQIMPLFENNPAGLREMRLFRASIAEKTGDRAKAEEVLKEILKSDPRFAPACNFLGYMYAEDGRHLDEAVRLILIALESEPGQGAYLDSLGWAYYRQAVRDDDLDKLRLAAEKLRAAIAEREDPVIGDHRADVAFTGGHWKDALAGWKRALELGAGGPGDLPNAEEIKAKIGAIERLLKARAKSPGTAQEPAPNAPRPLVFPGTLLK